MPYTQMSFCFYNASSIFPISSEEGRGIFGRLMLLFLFFREEFPVKKKQHQYPDGNVGVRQIEYRSEENEMFSAPYRQPRWEMPLNEREIEHIDHSSVQEGSVPAFFREQRGHLV